MFTRYGKRNNHEGDDFRTVSFSSQKSRMNLKRSSLNWELESKGGAPSGYVGATCSSHISDTTGCSCSAPKALVSLWQLWAQVLELRARKGWGPDGPTGQTDWEAARSVPPLNAPNIVQDKDKTLRNFPPPPPLPSHEFRFISLFLPFQQDMSLRTVLITPITPAINMDLFPFFYLSQHPTGDFNVIYSCPPLLKVGWFCCWTSGLLFFSWKK